MAATKAGKPPKPEKRIRDLSPDEILIPDERSYAVTNPEKIQELADSIVAQGVLVALDVIESGGKFYLTDGYHRLMVARDLGFTAVPCIVSKGTEKDILVRNLTLNKHRGQSDPIGECRVLTKLITEQGMDRKEAAKICGISSSWAGKILQLRQLPEAVQEMIRQREVPMTSALILLELENKSMIEEFAGYIKLWGWTKLDTQAAVNRENNLPLSEQEELIDFDESGRKIQVPLTCELCGKDAAGVAVYAWYHPQCRDEMRQSVAAMNRMEQEESIIKPVPGLGFNPSAPPQQGWQQPRPPPDPTYAGARINCLRCGNLCFVNPYGHQCSNCGAFYPT